jgi:hypothetical protein
MGEAQCNHSDNIDHRLTKKTLAAISVGETVGPLSWGSAKYWSEWQDLRLSLSDIEIFEVFVRSF